MISMETIIYKLHSYTGSKRFQTDGFLYSVVCFVFFEQKWSIMRAINSIDDDVEIKEDNLTLSGFNDVATI